MHLLLNPDPDVLSVMLFNPLYLIHKESSLVVCFGVFCVILSKGRNGLAVILVLFYPFILVPFPLSLTIVLVSV